MEEVWHFTCSVEGIRPQYKNGNEDFYSEKGMVDGQMWHVEFGPVDDDDENDDYDDNQLAGTCGLLKVSDSQAIPSFWKDAKWAVKRTITEADSIEKSESEFVSEYSDIMMKNIAFTLRGQGMEECCNVEASIGRLQVVTHSEVKKYATTGKGVHGLISSANKVTMYEAATCLADKFGSGVVRWLGRCTDPGRWQNSW